MRFAVFNDTSPTRHYGCMLVMANLERLLEESGGTVVWRWPVGKNWREYPELLPAKGAVDAVIVNGEGTMHHNTQRLRVGWLADVAAYANEELGVPAFLLNATIYCNTPDFYRKLEQFSAIYVRDSLSRQELSMHGLCAEVVPDLTLAKPFVASGARRESPGGTDSVLSAVTRSINALCDEQGWPFRKMVSARRPSWSDLLRPGPLARELREVMRARKTFSRSPESFLEYLAKRTVIVTGRYHAVTMSLLTRTPFVAVESNTPKISSLVEDVLGDASGRVLGRREIERADVEVWMRWRGREEERIDSFCADASRRIALMIGGIAARVRDERVQAPSVTARS